MPTGTAKPALNEDLLVHFGIKGMRWGRRTAKTSKGSSGKSKMSTKKKVAIGAGIAAGAAAVAFALTRGGKLPVKNVTSKATARGKIATGDISQSEWKRRVADLRKDIAGANADQDRWMRRQGLGAHLNNPGGQSVKSKVNMGNLDDVRRAWNDPNHVWDL